MRKCIIVPTSITKSKIFIKRGYPTGTNIKVRSETQMISLHRESQPKRYRNKFYYPILWYLVRLSIIRADAGRRRGGDAGKLSRPWPRPLPSVAREPHSDRTYVIAL